MIRFACFMIALTFLRAQDEPLRRARELVEKLGAGAIEERDRAQAELLKLGERSRGALAEALKDQDSEIRARAEALLGELDRQAAVREIEKHAGKLGESGVFWVEQAGFDRISDRTRLPDWMKVSLVRRPNLDLALVHLKEDRVTSSEIAALYVLETQVPAQTVSGIMRERSFPSTDREGHFLSGSATSGQGISVLPGPQVSDIFSKWQPVRDSSITFVSPWISPMGKDAGRLLLDGLKEAAHHERRDIRAAAAHVLMHYRREAAVVLALEMLEDKEPLVQDGAWESLKGMTGFAKGTPEELKKWWAGLSDEERRKAFR